MHRRAGRSKIEPTSTGVLAVSLTKIYVAAQVALADKKGAAMVEYALLAALIAVVAVTALTSIGTNISTKFNAIATSI